MKYKLMTAIGIAITFQAAAQKPALYSHQVSITSRPLEVTYQKTTSLIFNSEVKSIDRGSDDIIVQKATGVENVLRVKAASLDFEETNLSVVTADGQFYHFDVNYKKHPANLAFTVNPGSNGVAVNAAQPKGGILFSEHQTNDHQLRKLAAQASITRKNIKGVKDGAYQVEMQLTGLYLYKDWFAYKFIVTNNSNVTYNIERLSFTIQDRKKLKRTATQEISLQPVLLIGSSEPIQGSSSKMLIALLPKQVISADKQLIVFLEEQSGGRHLRCQIRSNTLLKAKPITITSAVDNIPNVLSAGK